METLQNLFHWFLCALFILETISVVYYLTELRKEVRDDSDGTTFGVDNETLLDLYKYVPWTKLPKQNNTTSWGH